MTESPVTRLLLCKKNDMQMLSSTCTHVRYTPINCCLHLRNTSFQTICQCLCMHICWLLSTLHSFSWGQAAMLIVCSDWECRYCVKTTSWHWDNFFMAKLFSLSPSQYPRHAWWLGLNDKWMKIRWLIEPNHGNNHFNHCWMANWVCKAKIDEDKYYL